MKHTGASIVTQLVAFTVIVTVLAVGLTGATITSFAAERIRASITDRNQQILERVESEMSAYFSIALNELEVYADQLAYFRDAPIVREIFLENLVLTQGRYNRFLLIDGVGSVILDTKAEGGKHQDLLSTRWHTTVERGVRMSDVGLSSDELPIVTCITETSTDGIQLAGELNIYAIWEIVDAVRLGATGYAMLTSEQGRVIAHPDKTSIFTDLGTVVELDRSFFADDETRPLFLGGNHVIAYTPVEIPKWSLYLLQPIGEAFLPVRTIIFFAALIVLLWAAVASIFAYIRSLRMLSPLIELTAQIQSIDFDALDRGVDVKINNEIGKLGEAFDGLLLRLHDRNVALQHSERKYRMVTDNASDILLSIDAHGKLLFLNKRFEELTAHSISRHVGHDLAGLLTPDSREVLDGELDAFRRNPVAEREFLVRMVPQRGTPIPLEVKLVPRTDDEGATLFFGVARDITEKTMMQSQLRQAEKLSSLGEIISGVAHEINNPISCITGYTDLLMRYSDLDKDVARKIEIIHDEAVRTAKIVKNLLSFSRKKPIERKQCDIGQLVLSVLDFRSYELRLCKITVEEHIDRGLRPAIADADQLRQVFLNLVNNSIHALQEIGSNRRLKVAVGQTDTHIHVSIKDNGPGIGIENHDSVFDPFFTTKDPGSGTGLGLSVSLGIVVDHGGRIIFTSDVGEGTEFVVELPHLSVDKITAEELRASPLGELPPMKVLVVDDEATSAQLMDDALSNLGCDTTVTFDGSEAIIHILAAKFDEIICDYRMPDVDGLAVYRWLKENKPAMLPRFVLATGDILSQEIHDELHFDGIPILAKPYELDELHALLQQRQIVRASAVSLPPG
jgi:PAS domain S-box-containing protein